MTQAKSFTLDGKRHKLDAKVPAEQIRHMAGFWHVSVPDDEIREMIARRAAGQGKAWPDHCVRQAQAFAVKCHRDNQRLYTSYRF